MHVQLGLLYNHMQGHATMCCYIPLAGQGTFYAILLHSALNLCYIAALSTQYMLQCCTQHSIYAIDAATSAQL